MAANVGVSLAICIRESGHRFKMYRKNKNYRTMQISRFFPTFGKSNEAPLHRWAGGGFFILWRPLAPGGSAPAIQTHHHLGFGASWQEADPQPDSEPFLGARGMLGWRTKVSQPPRPLCLSGLDPGSCWNLVSCPWSHTSLTCWRVPGGGGHTSLVLRPLGSWSRGQCPPHLSQVPDQTA